jgi:predicted transcriptional regulator
MNKVVETLLERVADWPEEAQAELVRSIVDIETRHFGSYKLDDDERAAIEEAKAQAERGEFIPDEVIAAFFKRIGL